MENELPNIEKPDAFSEMIRQKLENHQTAVDASGWTDLQKQMQASKRKVVPLWYWMSGAVAVAVLAFVFELNTPQKSSTELAIRKTSVTQSELKTNQIASIEAKKPVYEKSKLLIRTSASPSLTTNAEKNKLSDREVSPIIVDNQTVLSAKKQNFDSVTNKIAESVTAKSDSVIKVTKLIPNSLVETTVVAEVTPKPKENWLLAASFGSAGNSSNGIMGFNSPLADRNIVSAETDYTSIMTPNQFTNIAYLPPLSVGLTLRKNLNKTLSIESGLVYTYLLTRFDNNGLQQNNARLHLHYVGVPLNLVAKVWHNPNWEVYVSAGGMLEKGVRSVYVQNQFSVNQQITTSAATNIDGLQWSVNGGVGTTYKLQPKLGIFFEPKASYILNNNQPISARINQPFVVGLTAGLRYELK